MDHRFNKDRKEAWAMPAKATSSHAKASSDNNGHAPVRAVLYARVSTEEQREKQSIETQIDFARPWCERENISLVGIYRDEGISGTIPFEDRPDGKRLLEDARQKKFNVVLVFKVDRLGRADVVSHIALHHLETLGVGLRSLTEPFDTATPQGRFMFSILVANSAMDRSRMGGLLSTRSLSPDVPSQKLKWSVLSFAGRPKTIFPFSRLRPA
jgi:hypothetical protein